MSSDARLDFSASFAAKVAQLMHTDKKSITSLTILADEHRDKSAEVVAVVCKRMQALPSGDHRLPLMYLIDSICQNLGRKGADYPKRFQQHLKPMFDSTVKHCSLKVKGSLYRMWNTWRKNHTFNKEPLAEVEAILNAHLTPEERQAALARPSAASVPAAGASQAHLQDPRKRPSPSASPTYGQEPSTKRPMASDPRRPVPPAAVAPPAPAPVSAPVHPQVLQLHVILDTACARQPLLRPLVESMKAELQQPMSAEATEQLVQKLAVQLQQALALHPPAPVAAPPPASLPPLPPPPPMQPFLPPPPMQPVMHHTQPMAMAMPPMHPMAVDPLPPAPWQAMAPSFQQLPHGRGLPVPVPVPAVVPAGRQQQHVEHPRPITFSEEDLKSYEDAGYSNATWWQNSRHSWLPNSLYSSIPFQCKTCGLRIPSQASMASHLDWHFRMAKRAAAIAKAGGSRAQNWYWNESEWIQADDVIFGVQQRAQKGGGRAAGGGADADSASTAAEEEAKKRVVQSVPADDAQKQCAMCGEEFKKEWSQSDEDWMYRGVVRMTPLLLSEARAAVAQIDAAKPATQGDMGEAQAAAHASKEEERQLALYRAQRVAAHAQGFQGRLLHQTCHQDAVKNLMHSKPPAVSASPSPSPPPLETTAGTTLSVPARASPSVSPVPPTAQAPSPQPAAAAAATAAPVPAAPVPSTGSDPIATAPAADAHADKSNVTPAGAAAAEEEEEEEEEEDEDGGVRIDLGEPPALETPGGGRGPARVGV